MCVIVFQWFCELDIDCHPLLHSLKGIAEYPLKLKCVTQVVNPLALKAGIVQCFTLINVNTSLVAQVRIASQFEGRFFTVIV